MGRIKIIAVILFLGGVLCFGIAAYAYRTYQGLFDLLAYYSLPESVALANPEFAATIANLKFGSIKFSVLGAVGLITGIFLFIKKFKTYEQANH